ERVPLLAEDVVLDRLPVSEPEADGEVVERVGERLAVRFVDRDAGSREAIDGPVPPALAVDTKPTGALVGAAEGVWPGGEGGRARGAGQKTGQHHSCHEAPHPNPPL